MNSTITTNSNAIEKENLRLIMNAVFYVAVLLITFMLINNEGIVEKNLVGLMLTNLVFIALSAIINYSKSERVETTGLFGKFTSTSRNILNRSMFYSAIAASAAILYLNADTVTCIFC